MPGNEAPGVTVGIYELEPFCSPTSTPSRTATARGITAIGDARSAWTTPTPTPAPGPGEAALDIEMVIGMAPNVNARVYVGPNGGSGPLDTYSPWSTAVHRRR